MESILQIRDLEKIYPNGVHALKKINLQVRKGEFLVIIGLSGSGKSTLLRCLNRLHDVSSGEVIFEGRDIAHVKGDDVRHVRNKIGMIFQHFNLISRHTVLSNVLMGSLGRMGTMRSIFGLYSTEDKSRALEYLNLVGIADKANMRADQLSGGQQQRVAIARTLMQNLKILLADEPVASLDPATCHIVMDYLKKVNRDLGLTVIANLHFLSLVRQYADRVVALKGGEIVFEGGPQEISEEWFQRIYGEGAKEVHIN